MSTANPTGASSRIPVVVERMIEATNSADSSAFLACFTEDAFLSDWGREFHGRDGVASWNSTDNIGVRAHFVATASRHVGADDIVTIVVSGGGYNGTSDILFTIRNGLIERMIISG